MLTEQALFDWIVKGFVAVLTWLGINLHSRVTTLEKESATKSGLQEVKQDLTTAINDLKDTMKDHREETRQGFSELRTILLKKPDRGE